MTRPSVGVRHEDGVAVVQLQRPETLNALTLEAGRELLAALEELSRDDSVRAMVLTGEGRGFSAGADLKAFRGVPRLPSGRADLGWALERVFNPLILQLRLMPQPVVAAVNGVAAGFGCSLALASDLVFAARSSSFTLAFVNVALVPDGGASLLVQARAGMSRALELSLLGRNVDAERAFQWNLINAVEDDDDLAGAAFETARRLAAGPPEAHAAIKALLNEPLLPLLKEQLANEVQYQRRRSDSDEVAEAVAAFREKRVPQYVS